jgi:hypothetical protein
MTIADVKTATNLGWPIASFLPTLKCGLSLVHTSLFLYFIADSLWTTTARVPQAERSAWVHRVICQHVSLTK